MVGIYQARYKCDYYRFEDCEVEDFIAKDDNEALLIARTKALESVKKMKNINNVRLETLTDEEYRQIPIPTN